VGVAVAGTGVGVGVLGWLGLGVDVGLRRVGRASIWAGGAEGETGAARAGMVAKAMPKTTIPISMDRKNPLLFPPGCTKQFSLFTLIYAKVTVSIYPFYTI